MTINGDNKRSQREARVNPFNPNCQKTYYLEGGKNDYPFNGIKSFLDIYFDYHPMGGWVFNFQTMSDFLGCDNIIKVPHPGMNPFFSMPISLWMIDLSQLAKILVMIL